MAAAPSTQLTTPNVSVDVGLAPPEIIRFRRRGFSGDYYQALGAAAQVRLRLLATLHARSELSGSESRESARQRLVAQQHQVWQQLQWLVDEMRRLDEAGNAER
ncbi:MAG TPA: hypothetical protein VGJ95_13755 [Pseudonocardiaceae bacterium]|jgi:hypothetical protein